MKRKRKDWKKNQKKKENKTANETKKNICSRGEETFGTPTLIENVSPHPVHRTTKPTEGGRVRPLDHQWTNPWLCVWFPNGTTALVSKERLQRYVYLEIRSLLSMWEPGTLCGTCYADLGWIRKGWKSADFEQKAWVIAHGFEHGGFWQVLEIAPNSLKRLQIPSKIISNSLRDLLCRFRVNSQGSKIGRFWAKSLGCSPWVWTSRILAIPWNRSKLSETPPNTLQNNV